MKAVFADASYWIAVLNENDFRNKEALEITQSLKYVRVITSEMVLNEFLNYFSGWGRKFRLAAVDYVRRLQSSIHIRIVPQTSDLFNEAMLFYYTMSDKSWGHTDCASMVIMKKEGIKDVLTTDRHFTQAGFKTLLTGAD